VYGDTSLIKTILKDQVRLLTFRSIRPNPAQYRYYLMFALLVTWLCGIGRYWDNPRAELWQYLGLGSVAYVFSLALVLWLIVIPLNPSRWSYRNVLLFVALTSAPALLYAIPVERFSDFETAASLNVWFLAIVASWRVALLFRFLKTAASLSIEKVIVAALLPLTLIVVSLTALNLEHVVFRIMAGLSEDEKSVNDSAYAILVLITGVSSLLFPLALLSYLILAYQSWRARLLAKPKR